MGVVRLVSQAGTWSLSAVVLFWDDNATFLRSGERISCAVMDGRLEGWAVQEESPVGFGRFLPYVVSLFLLVGLSSFVACFPRPRAARVLAEAEGRVDCSSEEAALPKKEVKRACFFMVNQTIPVEE